MEQPTVSPSSTKEVPIVPARGRAGAAGSRGYPRKVAPATTQAPSAREASRRALAEIPTDLFAGTKEPAAPASQ